MCRSIKTLRRPGETATTGELEAAARQYVRKLSGFREPSARNQEAFEAAVAEIAAWLSPNPCGVGPMTRALLVSNVVEGAERAAFGSPTEANA